MGLTRAALTAGFLGLSAALFAAACGDGGGASGDGDSGGGGDPGGPGPGPGATSGPGAGGCVPGVDPQCGGTGECSDDTEVHTGEATYYNEANGTGNCSFDATPNDLMIGAMNTPDYAGSAACGACVKLAGPKGEISIRIVDRCPECPQGNIDLSPSAFEKIADISAGKVSITWSYVPCPVMGTLVYHFKEGSNQWWTAVQIRNHRYAIKTVEYKKDDGTWKSIPRLGYNYFVEESGMGPGPYTMRVTDVHGQVIEDSAVPFAEASDSYGSSQFLNCEPK
jgi:expansin (peptidoglycan-binding protein)